MSTKFQLTNIKLKDLKIFNSNVEIPTFATVVKANKVMARNESGETINDQFDKIRIECIDSNLAQILLQAKHDLSQINGFTVEIIGDNAQISSINCDNLIGKNINLQDSIIGLKWVSKFNSGSYSALKLILDFQVFIRHNGNKNREN